MTDKLLIETARLILRPWKESDIEPFVLMNLEPKNLIYFPGLIERHTSLEFIGNIKQHFQKYGYGFWAVEEKNSQKFIGFVGLRHVEFEAKFTPAVEIGWRLDYEFCNKGYATEAAKAGLNFAFNCANLNKIVSFTTVQNIPSQNVMKKIGMIAVSEYDFNHPKLPSGHWLSRHLYFEITKEKFNLLNKELK